MRPWTDLHPKISASIVGGVLAAVVLTALGAAGVNVDAVLVDLGDDGELTVRQLANVLGAIAAGYLWPEADARELVAAPGELDGPGEPADPGA